MKLVIPLILLAASALAQETVEDRDGTLNPDEMGLNTSVQRALRGDVDMVVCGQGYLMTKGGRHNEARKIFENCAKAGYTGTMTWMSYMEDNGFGGEMNADAAADWDRQAAELGDPVGMFNYGLDLMRGRGVAFDDALGRRYIDQAAAAGLAIAKRLQDAGYDLDEVTPDADNWKYDPAS